MQKNAIMFDRNDKLLAFSKLALVLKSDIEDVDARFYWHDRLLTGLVSRLQTIMSGLLRIMYPMP